MPTPPRSLILDDANGNGKFDEGDDLKDEIKVTLGSYLSELTKTSPTKNAYDIAAELEEPASFNQVTDRTPPLVTGQGSGEPVYINDVAKAAKAYFETTGNGDFGDGDDPLLGLIDKTLRSAKHGEVLGSITGNGKSEVEQRVSDVLKNNRFTPGGKSPYIQNGERSAYYARTQKVMGEYVKDTDDDSKAVAYDVEDLQKIALSLLLKATGRAQNDVDPTSLDSGTILSADEGGQGLFAIASVRVGNEKLGAGDLEARNAYRGGRLTKNDTVDAELRDPEIPSSAGFFNFDTPGGSYGQTYSHLENFAPFGPYSPSPMALLLPQFVTIAASTAAVGLIIGLLTGDLGFPKQDILNPGTDVLPSGASRQSGSIFGAFASTIKKMLNVPETKAAFLPSVFVGLLWFQVSALYGGAGLVTSVQRGVARDTVTFMDQLANDDLFSGGFISDLNAIGIIIDSLIHSKFFRFTITMAVLGDKIITGSWKKSKNFNYGIGKANVDDLPDNALYRVAKSRKTKGSKGLAWQAGNIPSAYVLPQAFVAAATNGATGVGVETSLGGLLSNVSLSSKLINIDEMASEYNEGRRLPASLVEAIENQLEIEYVPFYFHDLRTNEIIAFHAFIQNISDVYSATWSAQTGIGRVEPAQIYGGTTRAISLKFLIAATNNKEDYDEMWFKVNKLTTLMYPQFSRGRVVSDGSINFVQPFSQVQTASPLVRIRLGDLFKSNYSKFSLARLFGLGQTTEAFQPAPTGDGGTTDSDYEEAGELEVVMKKVADSRSADVEGASGFMTADQVIISPTILNIAPVVPGVGATQNGVSTMVPLKGTVTIPILVSPPSNEDGASAAARLAALGTPAAIDAGTAETPEIDVNTKYLVMLDQDSNDIINGMFNPAIPGQYTVTVSHAMLQLQEAWYQTLVQIEMNMIPDPFAAQPTGSDFFSSENNAVVRSFESTRGRGLAGAITSMDFDWNEKPWATETIGSKAPIFCAVTLNFSPIHDITPGLDVDGFNRAPIYNVGKAMNGIGGDPYGGPIGNNEAVQKEINLQQSTIGTSMKTLVQNVVDET